MYFCSLKVLVSKQCLNRDVSRQWHATLACQLVYINTDTKKEKEYSEKVNLVYMFYNQSKIIIKKTKKQLKNDKITKIKKTNNIQTVHF